MKQIWRKWFLHSIMLCLALSGTLKMWGLTQALAETSSAETTSKGQPLSDVDALYETLLEQQAQLKALEASLKKREAEVQEAEQLINQQLQQLTRAETRLESLMAQSASASEDDLARIVQVYEVMKPKQASELFAVMEPEFAAEFLVRLSPEITANILANMQPEMAYALSVVMAGRNALAAKE